MHYLSSRILGRRTERQEIIHDDGEYPPPLLQEHLEEQSDHAGSMSTLESADVYSTSLQSTPQRFRHDTAAFQSEDHSLNLANEIENALNPSDFRPVSSFQFQARKATGSFGHHSLYPVESSEPSHSHSGLHKPISPGRSQRSHYSAVGSQQTLSDKDEFVL